jgi:hypothetical protein
MCDVVIKSNGDATKTDCGSATCEESSACKGGK